MYNIQEELAKYNLDSETYEKLLQDCSNKIQKLTDDEWGDIVDRYNLGIHYDSLRKSQQLITGGAFVSEYFKDKYAHNNPNYEGEIAELYNKIKSERIKLQTANLERNRIDRNVSRQELYYDYVGKAVQALIPPAFAYNEYLFEQPSTEYVVCLADIHYGACFKSENNEYSPEIVRERFEILLTELITFIKDKHLTKINVLSLGDMIQGILRLSDLKINDSSIVKATVEISQIIASFLNSLSEYVRIDYYHTPSANHTQLRPLGSKASELADEDLEYVISHYIKDVLVNNPNVTVHLADEGKQYIELNIFDFNIFAMHGHTIKNINNSLKNLSILKHKFVDILFLGHFHGGKELTSCEGGCNDAEILIAPSFIGSDPYSDSLMVGSKSAVKVYGINETYGHTETYKFVLN